MTTAVKLGINSGAYPPLDSGGNIAVPGLSSVRAYRDDVIIDASQVPTVFPGQGGAYNLVSIRPHPDYFLTSGSHYDPAIEAAINAMIQNGCDLYGSLGLAPQLSSWHEAGNLYGSGQNDSNGVAFTAYLTATKIRQVHVKMWNLVQAVNASNPGAGVGYGPITYFHATGAKDLTAMTAWLPTSTYPMDWYGVDVYSNNDQTILAYADMDAYLQPYRTVVKVLSGLANPKIMVPECNTHLEADRPQFFKNLGLWLSTNGGYRMLTFFKDGGASGGPWDPADAGTIAALNYVVANYG